MALYPICCKIPDHLKQQKGHRLPTLEKDRPQGVKLHRLRAKKIEKEKKTKS